MERSFVHLHCHSHYSLLDGAASIDKLVKRTVERGMNALALTDHGNLHGSLEFYRKAKSAGINPILGYEAYIAPGSRFAKDAGNMKEASYHLTLLAQNAIGFRNLMKLASAAFLEGFYFKPRIDRELLEHHSEGLVCLSGCVSGELSRTLLSGTGDAGTDLAEARDIVQWFQRVFNERYFLEIQNNGVSIQQDALVRTVELAERVGVPLVATSDAHYADREDAEAQDVMLCINTGKFRTDTQRLRMEGTGFYLRAPDEMYAAFPGHEDAVARSQEIANSVDIQLDLHKRHFPAYSAPSGEEPEAYLRGLCLEGLKTRYLGNPDMLRDGALTEVVMQRLDRELSVINQLGFANYFLIVWDFVRKARELNIPATARGSGVGALVSYALFLSHVCPIRFDLLFERFLDPSRKEAPDIDIDFCKERRGEVIRYVKDKYGEENVAQIGTFGTLAARAAIRDVGRVLGMPLSRVNQIVQMVPEELGISLDEALEKSTDLQAANSGDPEVGELLNLARRIEGLARNVGTHAAAVVIADRPLTEYVPLGRVTGKTDIITQWSMGDVEAAGLLKMDFLGLRNLTILSKAVDLIEQTTGERVDPYAFPLDDAAAFALLCRGETKGIFQLESGGIRDLLQKMKPDSFHDIIATNALYRPGPLEGGMVDDYVAVKHGKKAAVYKHEVLRGILQETNGVMVYQEQVMLILNRLGDIELANAYKCIKAISKKNQATIDSFGEQFLAGAEQKGLKHQDAVELWELIQKFAGYGFNKSHSTAYALIAYMTAYLKAHFPLEFMAALLSGDIPGRNFQRKDALVEHLEDCQRMDVVVVSPDVNQSNADFSVRDGKIQFGLLAIKGVRETAAQAIVDARRQIGKFTDLFHFCEQVDPAECGRSVIESLIKAGAFDSMGARRAQLFDVLERALEVATKQHADRKSGQKNLFAELDEEADPAPVSMPDIPEWNDREKLLMEKEVLGYYLTSHPLAEHESTMSLYCTHTTAKLADVRDRTEIALGGMLSSIKTAHVRKPRSNDEPTKYVNFDLEDTVGTIRCIMWPTEYAEYGSLVQPDAILVAKGVLDRRGGDEANLVVNELLPLSELQAKFTRGIVIRIDEQHHSEENLRQLREILRGYPGNLELHLILSLVNGMRVRLKSTESGVTTDSEMRRRVDELLGPGNFGLLSGKSTKTRPRPPSQRPSGQWAKR